LNSFTDEEELSESNSSSLDDNEYENVKKEMKATAIQPHFYVNVPERSGRQLNKPSSVATAKQKQVGCADSSINALS
jgi:hypothetical protein